MPLLLAALTALLSGPAAGLEAPTPGPTLPAVEAPVLVHAASHDVRITYAPGRGAHRDATIRIVPRRGARARWRGAIAGIAVHGPDGWVRIESLRTRDGGLEARARIPGPGRLDAFAIRTEGGASYLWGDPEVFGPPDPNEPDTPIEPEKPGEPPPGDDDCAGVNCPDIINPWTCECGGLEPWDDDEDDEEEEEESPSPGTTLAFGI